LLIEGRTRVLVEKSLRDLLAAFASSDPTPGGGSAAATASAMGASLLMMVSGLTKSRSGTDEDRRELDAARSELSRIQKELTAAVDADTAAYDAVVAAYRLPKATESDQAARKAAIQHALRTATDVPLSVARLSGEALQQARRVAQHGHKAAASDVGVAVALLAAGLHGARLNAEINVGSIADAGYKDSVASELERLAGSAAASADAAHAALSVR
jgi:formiminotetrahydrofolate cyclodeaminase